MTERWPTNSQLSGTGARMDGDPSCLSYGDLVLYYGEPYRLVGWSDSSGKTSVVICEEWCLRHRLVDWAELARHQHPWVRKRPNGGFRPFVERK
jgi:hypothetical protein